MGDKRVLLVLTSHDDLAGIRPTGYFVGEAAHPWREFTGAGFVVDVASVAGGVPPQDGFDADDPDQVAFLADPGIAAQLEHTAKLAAVDVSGYDAIFFVGGHGTMWDFPNTAAVAEAGRDVYEAGGVLAAVCHGPAALVNMTLSDGSKLIAGKQVAGFTNDEEEAVGLSDAVPFLLADELTSAGATHLPAANFTEQVIVDGRLVTGQNPQSAAAAAKAVVELLCA